MTPPTSQAAEVAGQVTLGEISRNVNAIRVDLAEFRQELANRPTATDLARLEEGITRDYGSADALMEARVVVLEGRVDKVDAWGLWFQRILGTALVAAVLALVIVDTPLL